MRKFENLTKEEQERIRQSRVVSSVQNIFVTDEGQPFEQTRNGRIMLTLKNTVDDNFHNYARKQR